MLSFEVLLPLGAAAFYLFDSSLMLHGNELALEKLSSRWFMSGGFDATLGGKRMFIPNPLTPHELLLQVRWDLNSTTPETDPYPRLEEIDRSLAPVKVLVIALNVVLLAVLPPVSWLYGAGAALLAVFVAAYLLIVTALAIVYRRRVELGLSKRRFAGLAFDALACAPFAVNMVRKISLLHSSVVNVESFMKRHLDESSRRSTAAVIIGRLEERIAIEDPATARSSELLAMLDRMRTPVP